METEFTALDRLFAQSKLKQAGLYSKETAFCLQRLMHSAREGHLCAAKDHLGEAIDSLSPTLICEGNSLFPTAPIVLWQDLYYLQKNWVYETYILQQVKRLWTVSPISYFDRALFTEKLKQTDGLFLKQKEAIQSALDHSLTLICGGPGTGKTHTAAQLVMLLHAALKRSEKKCLNVCLAAPTGKASSHLRSTLTALCDTALQVETATLHRLLKLQPGERRLFSGHRIDADLVIVDEASMIDVPLLAHLLEAIGEETLLILIGDPDQLPPVETKSLFSEMSGCIGRILDRCVRTKEDQLQHLAQAAKTGNSQQFFKLLDRIDSQAVQWKEKISIGELYSRLDPISSDVPPDPVASMHHYDRFRALNAMRQGEEGSDELNRQILQMLRGKSKWWAAPILATVNDSYAQVYNGMSGILIGHPEKQPAAYFPDPMSQEMRFFSNPPPYELGFCLSIHKSQGSEFERVAVLFPDGSECFGKEALYTAITRARKQVEIFGKKEVLCQALSLNARRMSGFLRRWVGELLV